MSINDNIIVVSCPIKRDNEYLIEFTEHYLNLGFDKIYFYDNNDDVLINPQKLLSSYIKIDKVEIIDYRNQVFHDAWHRAHFFSNYRFNWVLFVDDDEFLELKRHNTIKDFLSTFSSKTTKIALNNLHYGDNDKLFHEKGNVQERFPEPLPLGSGTADYKFNCAIKSLLKKVDIDTIQNINAHTLIDNFPYYNANNRIIKIINDWRMSESDVTYDTAFIKHYCTKSLEEFVKCKMKRAMSNNSIHKNRFNIDSYYYMYNQKTKEKENLFKLLLKQYQLYDR